MRPIDADAFRDYILKGKPIELTICEYSESDILYMINQQPTINQTPNDPLTLELLREMAGEPVWIRNHCTGAYICRIINLSDAHFTHFTDGGLRENQSYGLYWTAYRRKPEEE